MQSDGPMLYYLPRERKGLAGEQLEELGLGYAFDGKPEQVDVMRGPCVDGEQLPPGALMAQASAEAIRPVRLEPDLQVWHWMYLEVKAGPMCCGWYRDAVPGPASLRRGMMLQGHEVELGGRRWHLPRARYLARNESSGAIEAWQCIPMRHRWNGRRWEQSEPIERYAHLAELAERWLDTVRAAEIEEREDGSAGALLSFDDLHSAAAACMACNYRLGPDEISALGLFDGGAARLVLDALVDVPGLIKLEEAAESAGKD